MPFKNNDLEIIPKKDIIKMQKDIDDNKVQLNDIANKKMPSGKIVIFGDSLTARNTDLWGQPGVDQTVPHSQNFSTGWFTWANIAMRQKFKLIYNAGISGNTTTQMLARIQTDVIDKKPDWCIVMGGVNDIAGVSDSSSPQVISNLKTIYNKLLENNIRLIICTILPCSGINTANKKASLHSTNRWIKEYAWLNPNVVLVDWHHIMEDLITGYADSTYVPDGTHPNSELAAKLGDFLKKVINPLIPDIDLLPNNIQDTADNLLSNGFMTGNSSGKATGWSSGGTTATCTFSKIARTDGKPGEWQQIQVTGAGDVAFFSYASGIGTKVNVGDKVFAQIEFETDADITGQTKFQLDVTEINASSATKAVLGDNVYRNTLGNANFRLASGILRTPEMTILQDVTQLVFQFTANLTSGTIRLGRAEIRKVNY